MTSLAATHAVIHLWTTQSTLPDVIPNYTLSETLVEPSLSPMARPPAGVLLVHPSLSPLHQLQSVGAPIRWSLPAPSPRRSTTIKNTLPPMRVIQASKSMPVHLSGSLPCLKPPSSDPLDPEHSVEWDSNETPHTPVSAVQFDNNLQIFLSISYSTIFTHDPCSLIDSDKCLMISLPAFLCGHCFTLFFFWLFIYESASRFYIQ
jgi:hypothetical protein